MRLTPYWMASLVSEIVNEAGLPTVDSKLFERLNLQSQYAAAAYCNSAAAIPNEKIVCPAGNCPLVQAADVRSASGFSHRKHGDTNGFVAVDHTHNQIVVAFRGTQSNGNIIADTKFREHEVPELCKDCKVHSGFYTAWNSSSPMVYDALTATIKRYPAMGVTVVGHSLGGAVATLAAASLRAKGIKLDLYTFGSPRVGNEGFARYVTKSGTNYRVTHADDPVPYVPPSAMGYAQPYPEIHIMDKRLPVTVDRMEMLGQPGTKGKMNLIDAKRIARLDYPAHKVYFGNITACGPGLDKSLFVLVGMTATAVGVKHHISSQRKNNNRMLSRIMQLLGQD